MKALITTVVVFIWVPLLIADEPAWTLQPRQVPVPAAASDALKQSIRSMPAPKVEAAPAPPSSNDAWRAMVKQTDGQWGAGIPAMLEQNQVQLKRDEIAGVSAHWLTPAQVTSANEQRLFIQLHGGAYVMGGGDASLGEAILIAARLSIPVLSIDYRMPPDHPFPAAVNDSVMVYQEIIKTQPPHAIAIGGSSAGGGLALATVHRLRELGQPVPAAVYAGTPWADLTQTGDTQFTLEGIDRILVQYDGLLSAAANLYAAGEDLRNPLLSPVYGDFAGFPPTILFTGTRDLFLSDTARTHRKLRAAGVEADLHVFEGVSHADYMVVPDSPESAEVYRELGAFVDRHLK